MVNRRRNLDVLVRRRRHDASQGRGGGIVERTYEAGDIARRGCFAAAFIRASIWFAFKVNDAGIVLDDQNLSEVQVAMMAYLIDLEVAGKQDAQAFEGGLAPAQKSIGEGRRAFVQMSTLFAKALEDSLCGLDDRIDHRLCNIRRDRLGGKVRKITGRQGGMQLADPAADLLNAIEKRCVLAGVGLRLRGQQAFLL